MGCSRHDKILLSAIETLLSQQHNESRRCWELHWRLNALVRVSLCFIVIFLLSFSLCPSIHSFTSKVNFSIYLSLRLYVPQFSFVLCDSYFPCYHLFCTTLRVTDFSLFYLYLSRGYLSARTIPNMIRFHLFYHFSTAIPRYLSTISKIVRILSSSSMHQRREVSSCTFRSSMIARRPSWSLPFIGTSSDWGPHFIAVAHVLVVASLSEQAVWYKGGWTEETKWCQNYVVSVQISVLTYIQWPCLCLSD